MSAPSPEDLVESRRWFREAEEELSVATVLAREGLPARAACFHAHLAVEKALKAALISRGVVIIKLHDLVRLARMLPQADRDLFDIDDLGVLNPWTVEGRYPADLTEMTGAGVLDLIDRAIRAVATARAVVG